MNGQAELHIVPSDDLREHSPHPDCWCRPTRDDEAEAEVWIHHSLDGREDYERGERKPS